MFMGPQSLPSSFSFFFFTLFPQYFYFLNFLLYHHYQDHNHPSCHTYIMCDIMFSRVCRSVRGPKVLLQQEHQPGVDWQSLQKHWEIC